MLHYTRWYGTKVRYNMSMVIVWALSWWYGTGWKAFLLGLRERLEASYDYFSIGLLASTLFAPFRQISAGNVSGPIGIRLRAFVDKLISRFIGAIVRLVLIIAGIVWLFVQAVGGAIALVLWAVVPILPLVGFIIMLSGWVPSWR
jgi:hypothetical protein